MMDEFKSPDPLVLLLNEIDILLAQMRLMELCVQQAQAKVNYERERAQQKHEAELAAIRDTLAESQRVPTDGSAEAVEAKLLENLRTIENELNQALSILNATFSIQFGGPGWIRTSEGVSQQIYSLPRLSTSVPTHILLPEAAAGALYATAAGLSNPKWPGHALP